MQEVQGKKFSLKEKSWILYDWANSVYATNIMAVILPVIFVSFAGKDGSYWWGIGTSIATLLVAVLSPILGAIADFKGMKKKLFTIFLLVGVVFTAFIALTEDWRWMLVGYVVSHIGFSGANLFYDSFLTDVTTNERMDRVSTWGYAMGYIGGSTIPFVMSIGMLLFFGATSPIAQKFAILITSLWWIGFSIPFLKNVHQEHYIERPKGNPVAITLRNVGHTAAEIARQKGLLLFVIAYFFYIDGVGTIISISTAYGATLGLNMMGMIIALLATQIVAMPFSILFGKLAQKITTRRALLLAVAVYMFICGVGFVMGFSLEPHQQPFDEAYEAYTVRATNALGAGFSEGDKDGLAEYFKDAQALLLHSKSQDLDSLAFKSEDQSATGLAQRADTLKELNESLLQFKGQSQGLIDNYKAALGRSTIMFWAMAILVGTVQGGIQAISRSYYGKLVPKERSNEYFGFFDIFGKFAAVIGPLLYAFIGGLTGRPSLGTLALLTLFLVGFLILLAAKKPLNELEQKRAAKG